MNQSNLKEFCSNKLHRTIVAGVGIVLWAIVMFAVFSNYYTGCFEFIVEGKSLGYAVSKTAYDNMLSIVNTELSQNSSVSEQITYKPDTIARIIKKEKLTSTQDFHDNVASLSSYMKEAHTLVINNTPTISFSTESELNQTIDALKQEYSAENSDTKIIEEVSSIQRYVTISNIYTPDKAAEYIKNNDLLSVEAVTNTTYTESIAHPAEQIQDNTLYEGTTEVSQEGKDGEKVISAQVVLVNGIEKARTILSEMITAEPVTEICKIGTKIKPSGVGTGSFLFPTNGTISSRYGSRWSRQHKGVDIANSTGTDIKAADEGVVSFSGVQNGFGNIIIIDHKNGYTTYYGHCSELLKTVGDIVEKGEIIAKMGSTGKSTGSHLHFEVRKDGEVQNPLDYVSQ